jgi:hypothetical protein
LLVAYNLARPGSALSSEARAVRKTAAAVMRVVAQSQALFGARDAAISGIWDLVEGCAAPNWDSEGAAPIAEGAALRAEEFIRALPDGLPVPEVAPEPDGSISLDWIRSRHCQLSLSVGTGDRLAYAWLDGSDRGYAVVRWDGAHIPVRLLEDIRAVMSRGDAAVGAS